MRRHAAIAALAAGLLAACPQPIQTLCGEAGQACCTGGGCNSGLECGSDSHCRVCGAEGEGCCGGTNCNAGLRCGEGAICRACGGQNEGCCAGSTCDTGLECFEDDVCRACGRLNQECCGGTTCISGLECAADKRCKACGANEQLCCAGDRCAAGNECRADGLCHTCGAAGQACCSEQSCNTGLRCDINQCVTPCGEGCAPGAKQCSANGGVDLCTYTSPPCTEWTTVIDRCPEEQVCRDGTCAARCPNACTLGSNLCTSEGLKICELDTTTQCPVYKIAPASPDNPSCMTGACDGSICWEGKLPQGNDLRAIVGTYEDQLKLLDYLGNVVSLNYMTWSYDWRASNHADAFQAISSCNGGGRPLAVGAGGLVMTRNSIGWFRETFPSTAANLSAIGCSSSRAALAAGRGGALFARSADGVSEDDIGTWRALTSPTTQDLLASAVYGGAQGLAVGRGGTIVLCADLSLPDTISCQLEAVGLTTADLRAIWVNQLGAPTTGIGAGEVIAVGDGGVVLRRSPGPTGTWTRVATGLTTSNLNAVWGLDSGDVYVAGAGGAFLYRAANNWAAASFTTTDLYGVYASDDSHLFVVGDGAEIWFNDQRGFAGVPPTQAWRLNGGDKPTQQFLYAVAGRGAADVYAVGSAGAVIHKSGDAWRREAVGLTGVDLNSVLVAGADEVYAFGDGGTILARRNGIWRQEGAGVTSNPLYASFADATTVYAVGAGGTWLEKPKGASGTYWHLVTHPLPDAWFTVMAGNSTEVWALGAYCTALRKTSTGFTVETLPACDGEDVTAAWLGEDGEMFVAASAADFSPVLLHRVSGQWSREWAGLERLNAFAVDGSDVWALFGGGELWHRAAGGWSQEAKRMTSYSLMGAYAAPEGDVYMVGASGLIWHRR